MHWHWKRYFWLFPVVAGTWLGLRSECFFWAQKIGFRPENPFFHMEPRFWHRGACVRGPGRRANNASPTPLWGHRLPVTALALSVHGLDDWYMNYIWMIYDWYMADIWLMLMLWPPAVTPGVTHFWAYHHPLDGDLFYSGQGWIGDCGSWTRKATWQSPTMVSTTVLTARTSSNLLKLFSRKEFDMFSIGASLIFLIFYHYLRYAVSWLPVPILPGDFTWVQPLKIQH